MALTWPWAWKEVHGCGCGPKDCPPFLVVHFKYAPNYFHFISINFVLSLVLGVVTRVSTAINSPASSCGDKLLLWRLVATKWQPQACLLLRQLTLVNGMAFYPFILPHFFLQIFHCTPIVNRTNGQRTEITYLVFLIFEDTGGEIKPYESRHLFYRKMDILIIF